jgi:uncharacterized protein YhhL (DUF1145 family)
MPASYENRLFSVTPTASGYETTSSTGSNKSIGTKTMIFGAVLVALGIPFSGILRIILMVLGVLFILSGASVVVQAGKTKGRERTVFDTKARTVTQGATVLQGADITGIGLIPIRGFQVAAVHNANGKPLWLASPAKLPRNEQLVAAVQDLAQAMGVPYTE